MTVQLASHTEILTLPAVDKHHISEDIRRELNALAEVALEGVTGLLEYLQSPEALRNARRASERRIASRPEQLANREPLTLKLELPPNLNLNTNRAARTRKSE